MNKGPFEEYLRQSEPNKRDLGYAWQTAVGLQAVDGLETSRYLIETAKKNIEGKISIEEANALINSYYAESRQHDADRTKVSARIAQLLAEQSFVFSPAQYLSIHKRLFTGIYKHAGQIRDYNITKKEWVLGGNIVIYGGASELRATLDYDFATEKAFRYDGLSMSEILASCDLCLAPVADPCFRRGEHAHDRRVFHQVSADAGFCRDQRHFCGKRVVFQEFPRARQLQRSQTRRP